MTAVCADGAPGAATLVHVLRWRAEHRGQARACAFLDMEGTREGSGESARTYAELDLRARAIGARLQSSVPPGERVLLLYPQGLDFIEAFLGCLYARVVPVAVKVPRPPRPLILLESVAEDADPAAVLSVRSLVEGPEALRRAVGPERPWISGDRVPDEAAAEWRDPGPEPGDFAWLQYTSGSTSDPRGVKVTHANLVAVSELIRERFEHSATSHMLSWLPHYHDMGLVGGILHPLHMGFPLTLMSPQAFAQRPLRWLRALTATRATTSGAPNFAYELCARRVAPEALEELDLSAWEIAYNGAEPVRESTLDRFSERFAPCGFRREAFYPCYGMAETTLLIAGNDKGRGPVIRTGAASSRSGRIVSCGRLTGDPRIEIVDPDTGVPRPEGEVGEIWISGPGVAPGYWRRPEETEQVFRARIPGDGDLWLRTGDLGFAADGELYVSGRRKDLLIVAGVNHYAEDVEGTVAESHPWLEPGRLAAFSIEENDRERVVVAAELETAQLRALRRSQDAQPDVAGGPAQREVTPEVAAKALAGDIRSAVSRAHGIRVDIMLFLPPKALPRTTSGKIQRWICRDRVMDGSLLSKAHVAGRGRPPAAEQKEDARWRSTAR